MAKDIQIKSLKRIKLQIKSAYVRISKERDKLRELVMEAESIEGCCDSAIDDLERAVDSLSEYL